MKRLRKKKIENFNIKISILLNITAKVNYYKKNICYHLRKKLISN